EKMAADLQVNVGNLIGNENLLKQIKPKNYITEQIGEFTINDILKELQKPGLDPRSELEQFEYAAIYSIADVAVGMVVPGIVTNITRFGAFVDIGVKQDGLVHISELSHKFITDPAEAVKLNDKVQVKVLEVDVARKRIALSIKQTQTAPAQSFKKPLPAKNIPPANNNMNDALNMLKNKFKR
ncbi:MAG: S1 RNA-binding domain-containing protein, partial [Chitinophagaceae bacterium]